MTEALACTYAALMLHDDGKPITAVALEGALTAAGYEEVSASLPMMIARFAKTNDIASLIAAAPAAGGAPAAAPAAGGAAPAAAAGKKEAAKEESEEDDDMGMDLFS